MVRIFIKLTCSQSLVVTSVELPCNFGSEGRLNVVTVLLQSRCTRRGRLGDRVEGNVSSSMFTFCKRQSYLFADAVNRMFVGVVNRIVPGGGKH